jgi:hypothetical protein
MLDYFYGILSQKKSGRNLLFGSNRYNKASIAHFSKQPIYAFLVEHLFSRKWYFIHDYNTRDITNKNNDLLRSLSVLSNYGKVYTVTRFLTENWNLTDQNSVFSQNIIGFLTNMSGYVGYAKYYVIQLLHRYLQKSCNNIPYAVMNVSDILISNQNVVHLNLVMSDIPAQYLILCDNITQGNKYFPLNLLTMQYKRLPDKGLYALLPIKTQHRENSAHVVKVYAEGIFKDFALYDEGIYTLGIKKTVKQIYYKKIHRLFLKLLDAEEEYRYGVTSLVKIANITFVQIEISLDVKLTRDKLVKIIKNVRKIVNRIAGSNIKSYRIIKFFTKHLEDVQDIQINFSVVIAI